MSLRNYPLNCPPASTCLKHSPAESVAGKSHELPPQFAQVRRGSSSVDWTGLWWTGVDAKRSLGDDRCRGVDQVESAARRRHSRGPDWRIGSASRHGLLPAGAITTRVRTDS